MALIAQFGPRFERVEMNFYDNQSDHMEVDDFYGLENTMDVDEDWNSSLQFTQGPSVFESIAPTQVLFAEREPDQHVILDGLNLLRHAHHERFSTLSDVEAAVSTLSEAIKCLHDRYPFLRIHLVLKGFGIRGMYHEEVFKAIIVCLASNLDSLASQTRLSIYYLLDEQDKECDDRLCVFLAQELNGIVVSNDKFRSLDTHYAVPMNFWSLDLSMEDLMDWGSVEDRYSFYGSQVPDPTFETLNTVSLFHIPEYIPRMEFQWNNDLMQLEEVF